MIKLAFACVWLLVGFLSGVHSSTTCHDLNTQSCIGFHDGKPDLCDDPTFSQSLCKHFCGNCPLECYSCPGAILHPDDCKNITTCGPNMQCVNRHLRAKDGHHEYILGCESKELCDMLIGGFGKRSLDDLDGLREEERERYERDVILNCCDTDLCNFELLTTLPTTTTPRPTTTTPLPTTTKTTTTTTTTTTRATTTVPPVCTKDVVFMMQEYHATSGWFTHLSSASHWVPFVEQVVSQINVGPNATHVALATFDSHTMIKLDLSKRSTLADVMHTLSNLEHEQPHSASIATNLLDPLHQLTNNILNVRHGDRPGTQNVVVFLESGAMSSNSFNHADIHSELPAFRNATDTAIIISVGAVPDPQYHGLATDSSHMFHVSDYNKLHSLVSQISNMICS